MKMIVINTVFLLVTAHVQHSDVTLSPNRGPELVDMSLPGGNGLLLHFHRC